MGELHMTSNSLLSAMNWLSRIHDLIEQFPKTSQPIKIMNVCGGHERSIAQEGLRQALPAHIELVPGPGCPVCVCPEEDIHLAIQIALKTDAIVVTFGDMLRVPVNVPKNECRTLEEARALGGNVKAIASPLEVLHLCQQYPDKDIVFLAVGFETTMAPISALFSNTEFSKTPFSSSPSSNANTSLNRLKIILSGKLTWPAVEMLLHDEEPGFDALIAPGHVCTIMGYQEWESASLDYHIPTAVAGFQSDSLLAAFYSVLKQLVEGKATLSNCYPAVVSRQGNTKAQEMLCQHFSVGSSQWRGIGDLPDSGYHLEETLQKFDAKSHYSDLAADSRKRAGEMPHGCDCNKVILAKCKPNECRLYGKACTPSNPKGPCMVSDEGACRIWWSAGER